LIAAGVAGWFLAFRRPAAPRSEPEATAVERPAEPAPA
jgi:hypothetical protein